MDFKGKCVVVTGASRGIGRAIALLFAEYGAQVVLNYLADRSGAEHTACQAPGHAVVVQGDVSTRVGLSRILEVAMHEYDKVDILVNNAGVNTAGDLFEVSETDWKKVIEVNLKAILLSAQIFGAHMLEKGEGTIINIASTAGIRPAASSPHYVASKAGVIGLTKALALRLAPTVRVNAVAPGYILTEKRKRQMCRGRHRRLSEKIPLQRLGHPEEVAATITFLAKGGSYITGQTLVVDGGLVID